MVSAIIIVSIAFLLLVWFIYEKSKKYDLKELFIKTAISVLFVFLALITTYNSGTFTIFNVLVIMGLVFGLLGDILLDLKAIDLERTKGYTYTGFITFGLGHILFITALIMKYYKGEVLYIILAIITDIVISAITILMEKPLKLKYGKMKPTVLLYALCLFGTVSFSLFLAIENGFQYQTLTMFFIGAVLFAASDLILSGTYFGEGKERPVDFVLNYVFYYGAQFTIAFSLLFLV